MSIRQFFGSTFEFHFKDLLIVNDTFECYIACSCCNYVFESRIMARLFLD